MKKTVKQTITTKRLEEIEDVQNRIRKLAEQYKTDFVEPNDLDSVIEKDLKTAVDSLDLIKNVYKSKTEKSK